MDTQFSPEQVEAIIRKASDIQRTLQVPAAGLTRAEIERAAAGAGISPEAVAKAIEALHQPAIEARSATSDTHIYETRDLQPPAGEGAWDDVVDELKHTFGSYLGKVKHDLKEREWIHTGASGIETRVSLRTRGDRSRLRLSQRVGAAGPFTEALLYGSGIAGILTVLSVNKVGMGLVAALQLFSALLVAGSAIIHLIDRTWRKHKARQLSELADRLARIAGSPGQPAGTGVKQATDVPIQRIRMEDLLVPDDEPDGPLVNVLKQRS